MLEQEERLRRFLDEIVTEAAERRDGILTELRTLRAQEMDEARQEAETLRKETVIAEEKRLITAHNAEVNAQRDALRRELVAQREELARDVLARAHEKLAAFVQGADYAAYLQAQLAQLRETFAGKPMDIFVRPADVAPAQSALGADATVHADEGIALGGVRLVSGAVTADGTLDARLDALHSSVLASIALPEIA
ncbi:MAG: V-type ATP synthase subunit E [Oscillospiraceae bacterium]|jgi:vacuolar-type H+-ATPase subunit E/Vma4|nr:V-type ATP synthase subunit E [Oscillospiraceae bacterium]